MAVFILVWTIRWWTWCGKNLSSITQ